MPISMIHTYTILIGNSIYKRDKINLKMKLNFSNLKISLLFDDILSFENQLFKSFSVTTYKNVVKLFVGSKVV